MLGGISMGFLDRLFGKKQPPARTNIAENSPPASRPAISKQQPNDGLYRIMPDPAFQLQSHNVRRVRVLVERLAPVEVADLSEAETVARSKVAKEGEPWAAIIVETENGKYHVAGGFSEDTFMSSYENFGRLESCFSREAAEKSVGPRKRNAMDVWPQIVAEKATNPDKEGMVTYTLIETSLGNPMSLPVTTQQYCVYCERFSDPEFRDPAFPDGGGYCSSWNGAVSFKDSCNRWKPITKVRYWISKGYMTTKSLRTWHQLFDDGPDGEKGTR
jgi:hypothetical protein